MEIPDIKIISVSQVYHCKAYGSLMSIGKLGFVEKYATQPVVKIKSLRALSDLERKLINPILCNRI